jgi:hypothetical protein
MVAICPGAQPPPIGIVTIHPGDRLSRNRFTEPSILEPYSLC